MVPLLGVLIGACAVTALAAQSNALREHFRRTLAWITATAALWSGRATPAAGLRLCWRAQPS
ncbi:hypothetical protein [Streptomyces sp. NPDC058620]|uniref:hypothetical protein n=1 Tax=Streptomyces sp. NPDC058620 TaxID=3346560 RepID=UPI003654D524